MKSHLSGSVTKLHSFYRLQTGSCSKITSYFPCNRSFKVFRPWLFDFSSNLTNLWHLNLRIVCQKFTKTRIFDFPYLEMSPKNFRNFIITGNWVILTYKSAIHGKGSFSQIIFSFRGFYSPVKHDILSLSRLKILSSGKDLDFET